MVTCYHKNTTALAQITDLLRLHHDRLLVQVKYCNVQNLFAENIPIFQTFPYTVALQANIFRNS